eukprot:CAMPEP_0183305148 /NCGR_PEP_ID=MMETSP0160_2-20130417/9990_1 /TAXON_ID=2839 ORGANISM="Odontella Sinensis, Strain Grunow 1884" /NCGR_SAMPLE_ID=MMETSP0160_2 /ASSEMBLY_ACC=CAM_ASM_000250 /LENGTH=64 /DNA_ID=CAMNT_0025468309 /DNA_START=95 /DNA_END=286 /DNA_ORIENTATION=+
MPLRRVTSEFNVACKMRPIYDEMRSRQIRAIESAGIMRSDPNLVPDAVASSSSSTSASASASAS